MGKQKVVYPDNGVSCSHKKERSTDTRCGTVTLETAVLSEGSRTQEAPRGVIPFMRSLPSRLVPGDGRWLMGAEDRGRRAGG